MAAGAQPELTRHDLGGAQLEGDGSFPTIPPEEDGNAKKKY